MTLLGSLAVPSQSVEEALLSSAGGTLYELDLPRPIAERPYLGQNYLLSAISLRVIYRLRLGIAQEEAFAQPYDCHLELLRGAEVVAIFPLEFQMRKVPETGGREWLGEAAVFADLTNPVDYTQGQTLHFRVSGVVPGNVGGPQPQPQREREEAALANQAAMLAKQAEIITHIADLELQAGQIGAETIQQLEEVVKELERLE